MKKYLKVQTLVLVMMKLMLLRGINNLNKDIKKNVLKNNRSVAENFNLYSKILLC